MTDTLRVALIVTLIALLAIAALVHHNKINALAAGNAAADAILRTRLSRAEAHSKQLAAQLGKHHEAIAVFEKLITQNAQAVHIMHQMIEDGLRDSTRDQAQAGV